MKKLRQWTITGFLVLVIGGMTTGLVSAQDETDTPEPQWQRQGMMLMGGENLIMEYLIEQGITLAQLREAVTNEITWQELVETVGGDMEVLRAMVMEHANQRFEERMRQQVNAMGTHLREWHQNRRDMRGGRMPFSGNRGE